MEQELKQIKILLVIMIVLYVLHYLIDYYNKKVVIDNFCSCSGLQRKVCDDPEKLKALYAKGLLTEYNFPANLGWSNPLKDSSRNCNNPVRE